MYGSSPQADVEWYRKKAIDAGGPVLELGAGTGRVTIPIAEAGVRVSALDLDAGMLERLRQKLAKLPEDVQRRVAVHHGDMRAFALDQQFALVIIPFRAFLHNITHDDQLAALRCAHAHLKPGGQLAFNLFHPSLEYMAAHAGAFAGVWRWLKTDKRPDGEFVVYSDVTRYDTVRQRLEAMIRTEEFAPDGALRSTNMMHLELAYLYPSDISRLLAESGFEMVRLSGDFAGRPFERDGDELVVEARKLDH
jgi:SAM-dependent methyltransferase